MIILDRSDKVAFTFNTSIATQHFNDAYRQGHVGDNGAIHGKSLKQ